MSSEKVVVSAEELVQLKPVEAAPPQVFEQLPSPIPWWARICMFLLVPVFPLLAIITIVLRIAFRNQPRNVRFAWVSLLSTLLVVSGLITCAAGVAAFSFAPIPAIVNEGLPDLDERHQFSSLPSSSVLSSAAVSEQLKPLVVVVSPASRLWNHQEVASNEFGAGVLLLADKTGYLFATAKHVVKHTAKASGNKPQDVMIATASGVWSTASIVAMALDQDVALLWVARHSGSAAFVQPLAAPKDGEPIFAIGHPEGLKFTLSTGIISGLRDQIVQVSAAISPGNSGGPLYDDRGNLVGVVTSKFDHNVDPNAENIGFAVRADTLLDDSHWNFSGNGKNLLDSYIAAIKARRTAEPIQQGVAQQ